MSARRRSTKAKAKKKSRKKVTVSLLKRKHGGKTTQAYEIMDKLIEKHHTHLAEAKIAICWRFGWNADADGRLRLGQCKKASDCDRALREYDFVLLLNHEMWNASNFSQAQMKALIDHELCHAQVSIDADGEPRTDEQGRTCYRTRKHDVEEFTEVVTRHDLYTSDLERFAAKLREDAKRPLLPAGEPEKTKLPAQAK